MGTLYSKMDLCKEVEKLGECADSDLPRIARELKLVRLRWKDTGSVPHEKSEEIWKEFANGATNCKTALVNITTEWKKIEKK